MRAAGEIRLSTMTMRRMQVLAQSQPAPQKTTPKPPCMSPQAAQSNHNSHVINGAAVGFSAGAVIGGVLAANLVGFPEVPIAEAGVGAADLILIFTETAGGDAVAVGGATGGGYGAVIGGAFGAAVPSGGC